MKTGVLLINLGTPDSPSTSDVRKYLTQFLNDPRVIDINPVSRFFLVNGIIIPFRTAKSAKLYQHIWTKEGSPLLLNSIKQKNLLQKELGNNFVVELGMRYQNPSLQVAINKLKDANVNKIIAIPLYPQYATSSTTSSIEETNRILKKWKNHPPIQFINNFFDDAGFIDACVDKALQYKLDHPPAAGACRRPSEAWSPPLSTSPTGRHGTRHNRAGDLRDRRWRTRGRGG